MRVWIGMVPQSEILNPPVAGAVQRHHTSRWVAFPLQSAGPSVVAVVLLMGNVPRPAIACALAQLSAPCAKAGTQSADRRTTRAQRDLDLFTANLLARWDRPASLTAPGEG